MNFPRQLMRKARLMFCQAIMRMVDDARNLQTLQVTLLNGEVRSNVLRLQDFGFTSVPHDGAQAVAAAMAGDRDRIIIIACDDGRYRKKNLAPGESAVYNSNGDYVLLKVDGTMEVKSTTKVKVISPEAEVIASTKAKVTSPEVDVVAATKVSLQTPLTECSGNLAVAGGLSVTGTSTLTGNVTAAGTITGGQVKSAAGRDLDTLRVTGVQPGAGNSGTPV